MEYYRKVLSRIEAERHFIYVSLKARSFFPPIGNVFSVQIGYNEFQCRLDNQGRIWANSNNLKDYIDFYLENVFIFTKKDQDKYKLVLAHY